MALLLYRRKATFEAGEEKLRPEACAAALALAERRTSALQAEDELRRDEKRVHHAEFVAKLETLIKVSASRCRALRRRRTCAVGPAGRGRADRRPRALRHLHMCVALPPTPTTGNA